MSKLKNPLQATGHQICSETGSGICDPRGSRQLDAPAKAFHIAMELNRADNPPAHEPHDVVDGTVDKYSDGRDIR